MTDTNFKANLKDRFDKSTHDLLKKRATRACFLFEHLLCHEGTIVENEGKLFLNGRPVEKYARSIIESVVLGTGISCALVIDERIVFSGNTAFPTNTSVPERIIDACYNKNDVFEGTIATSSGAQIVSAKTFYQEKMRGMVIAAAPKASLTPLENLEIDVLQLVETMEMHKSQSLNDFIGSIRSIAKRIHLLALNASILSAQAGEHGRGFAVVAREIGELAEKTKQSTQELEKRFSGTQRSKDIERRNGGRPRT